jgi:hypothetical protein
MQMQSYLRLGAVLLALAGTTGLAVAQQQPIQQRPGMTGQETMKLTAQQRQQVYQMVMKEKPSAAAPAGISLRIGAKVPATVELQDLPDAVASQMPNLRQYKFIVAQNQVVLVDPSSNEIVEIIRQ